MSIFRVSYNPVARKILVLADADAVPSGAVVIGNIETKSALTVLSDQEVQVAYHVIRDLLYKQGIWSTQNIEIKFSNTMNLPVQFSAYPSIATTGDAIGVQATATDAPVVAGTGEFVRRRWLLAGRFLGSASKIIIPSSGPLELQTIAQNPAGYEYGITSERVMIKMRDAGNKPIISIPTPTPTPAPTPTPTPTPAGATPQQPEEAAISPAPTTLRSTYEFTKQGVITGKNAVMIARGGGGLGPYFPTKPILYPSATYPDRHLCFYTTDHDYITDGVTGSGSGGFYVVVCVADPSVPANWKVYADALAAGWLNDIPNKPASEPIYIGEYPANAQAQAETACIHYVPEAGKWVATFQVTAGFSKYADGKNYINQGTVMAVSTDLLNWSGNIICVTPAAVNDLGDGHVGYFMWGKNPFPGLINPATSQPWKYVGYGSLGGGGASPEAQWGSDNPGILASAPNSYPWTRLAKTGLWGGRAAPNYPNSDTNSSRLVTRWMDVESFRPTRQGYAGLMTGGPGTAGAGSANRSVYEVLMDDKGREMLGRPIQVLTKSGASKDYSSNSAHAMNITDFADKRVGIFEGQGRGENVLAIATSPKRNPANTWFTPLDPPIPSDYVELARDLKNASAIPAGFTAVSAGSPSAPTFSASGTTIAIASGQEYYLFENTGFIPADTDYVDLYLEDWIGLTGGSRIPYIGFAREKDIRSGLLNAVAVTNGEGTGVYPILTGIVGGVATYDGNWNANYEGIGYGNTSGVAAEFKDIGIRWFPKSGRLFGLGLGRTEVRFDTTGVVGTLDLNERMYAFVGFKGMSATAAQERIGRIVQRKKEGAASLQTLTPSTTFTQGVAIAEGTLAGRRAGSTIVCNIPGVTYDNVNNTYSGTPTSSGIVANAFVETLAGATGSPKPTPVTVGAAAAFAGFVLDNFTAANGVAASSHLVDVGGPLSTHNGTTTDGVIQDGRLAASGVTPRFIYSAAPPSANYEIEFDFTVVTLAGYPQILARMSSGANTWLAAAYQASSGVWRILRTSGTTTTTITTDVPMTLNVGQTYRGKFRVQNDTGNANCTATLFVDGTQIMQGTTNTASILPAGQIGVQHGGVITPTTGIHIDNVKATGL